jgi:hypothetical protein
MSGIQQQKNATNCKTLIAVQRNAGCSAWANCRFATTRIQLVGG